MNGNKNNHIISDNKLKQEDSLILSIFLKSYVVGYVQEASGRYRPVTSTTLSLPHLAEKASIPKNILTRFTSKTNR